MIAKILLTTYYSLLTKTMNIPLPSNIHITQKPEEPYTARVEISPLYPGYGVTIGNSLRRVLLSSLPGAAITAVKIQGANHEFMTLPHVKEEVLEIILNLKQIHLQVHTDEKEKVTLEVKGKKEATAGDFKKNSNVDIVNPDLHIATLTNKEAELIIEATVEKGIGFSTVEEREKENEVGIISVDALFSPIKTVGYTVEDVRVGKRTDYDKLILEIETDGSMDVKEALRQASGILVQQLNFVYNETGGETAPTVAVVEEVKKKKRTTKKSK